MEESTRVSIAGVDLACRHCRHTRFIRGWALLHLPAGKGVLASMFRQPVTVYSCERCGRMEWFLDRSEEDSESFSCLTCGTEVPRDSEACPACGWTWGEEPARPPEPPSDGTETCLVCGQPMPGDSCEECGWSYRAETGAPRPEPEPEPEPTFESTLPFCGACGTTMRPGSVICPACGGINN